MKLIIAIVKPFKLDEVVEALTGVGVQGLTVTEAKGFGRQKGQTEVYRGADYSISAAAKTDAIGDGKIFTIDVSSALRIRTGETDDTAL